MLRAREISARELLDAHLDRIDRLNPDVNAVVTLDAEGARAAADAADAALAAGEAGRPAARPAGRAQGHPRHRRHADDVGLAAARRHRAAARRAGRGPATRRPAPSGSARPTCPEFAAGSHTFNPVFGRDPQPVPARPLGRAARPAGRRRPWPRASCRWPRAATWAARCATRPRSATSSACGPPRAGCRRGRPPMGWSQLSVQGPMGRTVADVALQLSVARRPGPAGADLAGRRPGRRSPLPCRSRLAGLRVAWAPDLGGRVTGRPGDHVGAGVVRGGVRVARRLGGGGLPRPVRRRRGVRHAARLAVRGDLRRARAAAPGQGEGVDPLERRAGREAHRPRPRPRRDQRTPSCTSGWSRSSSATTSCSRRPPRCCRSRWRSSTRPRSPASHQDNYLEWMRSCTVISATGCPALSVPGGFTPDGLPVGLQIIGAPARRPARARGRARLRAGHPLRRSAAPPSDAFYGSLARDRPRRAARADRDRVAYFSSGRGRRRAWRRLRRPRSVRTATSSSASSCRSPAGDVGELRGRAGLGGVPGLRPARDQLVGRVGVRRRAASARPR